MLSPELVASLRSAWAFFIHLGVTLVPLFLGGAFLVGLTQEYLPPDRVERALRGQDEGAGNVLAAGFGAVTPFCSCSTVPLLAGLLQAGAPLGLAFSFLLASPLVNEIAVLLLLGVFGLEVTAAYVAVTLTAAVVGGVVIGRLGLRDHLKDVRLGTDSSQSAATDGGTTDCCTDDTATNCGTDDIATDRVTDGTTTDCGTDGTATGCGTDTGATDRGTTTEPEVCCTDGGTVDCCGGTGTDASPGDESVTPGAASPPQSAERRHRDRVASAAREASTFFRDTIPYLLVGMTIGALIHSVVPVALLQAVMGPANPLAVPLAAAVGAPIYVSPSGAMPIADSLASQGIPVGTVIAFIVGGAGMSVPNLVLLNKLFDRRLLAVYALTVAGIGTGIGVLFNVVFV